MAQLTMTAIKSLNFLRSQQEALSQLASKYSPPLIYEYEGADIAADTHYLELPHTIDFDNFSLELDLNADITLTIYASLDSNAVNTIETGWVDKTDFVFGAASMSDVHDCYYSANKLRARYLLKIIAADATNTCVVRLTLY